MYIPGGYILLSRKLIESRIWEKPPMYLKVWVFLLSNAQHSQYKKLNRGQLRTSIPEIQEACSHYVGFRKETPSKSQIYRIIEWLRKPHEEHMKGNASESMIKTMNGTHGMVVTICNYGVYQDPKSYERNNEQNNENDMNGMGTKRSRNNINKNVNNDKESNNDNILFEIEKIYNSVNGFYKGLFQSYIELYRSKNKSGKITDNRHYKLLKEINQIYQEKKFDFNGNNYKLTDTIFQAGINKIVEKQIDNLNYAKQIWINQIESKKDQETVFVKSTVDQKEVLEWYNEQV